MIPSTDHSQELKDCSQRFGWKVRQDTAAARGLSAGSNRPRHIGGPWLSAQAIPLVELLHDGAVNGLLMNTSDGQSTLSSTSSVPCICVG